MSLRQYLERFANAQRVTVVGPCWNGADPELDADAAPLVWVDGGAQYRSGDTGFCVGDGDSYDGALDETLPTDKDYSDFAYALGQLPAHFSEVRLLGFLGGRADHQLFNFGEAQQFLAGRANPTRVDFESQVTAYSAGIWQLEIRGTFSLAAFAPARVGLRGACRYPITPPRAMTPLTSLGLSNHGSGAMTLECDAPIFIFRVT